ncbi:glycine--tRNA ligase [Candidatus Pacearchaeota archaeon CG1_02_31_27]|nr:MAG: glycine--tRNA ligase [Candidatus Pacearchaeota archaeon CG1_02_31_27]PIN92315.1 MAG: glycine--tRNA ligase [Candidatus Pacearchaeota archaeon CG10_big_fil_rev_8_21_14_0_10_31_59]PIZ79983.1 MAG: glycine--tRNA ligase [Candidatus Pacearchaeota archaeon CG_4_10_14_0_2_um_filter_31_10]
MENKSLLDEITNIASRRGFFFQTAEIYPDNNSGFLEYGPYGVELKNKIISQWRKLILKKDNMLEIDGSQILPPSVFIASGHLKNFTDPLVYCEKCKNKFRADKIIEDATKHPMAENLANEEYDKIIEKNKIMCPKCKSRLSKTLRWNLMFKTGVGAEEKDSYLRPETCQSIFLNFPRLSKIMRMKLPIGIAQVGKSFRNEISPRQGILRMREFTQAEVEVFFNPKKENDVSIEKIENETLIFFFENKTHEIAIKNAIRKKLISSKLIAYYLFLLQNFYLHIGFPKEKIRFRKLNDDEKAFYAKEAFDFEVLTSIDWVELVACNHRGDYDLSGHQKNSREKMEILDESTNSKVLPNVFELSLGIDRTLYSLMDLGYEDDKKNERTIFKFNPKIAPIQVAIFPLLNKDKLPEKAQEVYNSIKDCFDCFYDEAGSIGKRYRRQDEIGTPFCITIDHDTLKDNSVTVRERDNMKQERVKIKELQTVLWKKIFG